MAKFRVDVDFDTMDKVDAISIINDCIDSLHRIKEELLEDENEDDK